MPGRLRPDCRCKSSSTSTRIPCAGRSLMTASSGGRVWRNPAPEFSVGSFGSGHELEFDLAVNLVGGGLAAVDERRVGAFALTGLHYVVDCGGQNFPVLQAYLDFDVEGFLAYLSHVFSGGVPALHVDPVVWCVCHWRLHPGGGQLYFRLRRRNVPHQQGRDLG